MPLNRLLFDSTVELHLDMEMVAIQSRATIVKLLQNLEKELIAKVTDGVTDWSKARIAKQLSEADAVIRQYYDDAAGIARDTTTSVAQVAASATADSLVAAVGAQVAISAIPTAAYLETLASDTIIQGVTQSGWWSKQSSDSSFKFQSAVRQGLVGAETTPQIVRRVRDVMDLSRRNAETLVHTSVQSVANTTREKIFADNDDVMSGKEWSAALDRRTCPTCGVRDGKRWDTKGKSISHSIPYTMPPQHFRCRCSMVPVLKTWKELGINMDELPDGTRASMEGQVNDKTFADWLKRKTETDTTFADKTLGKGRAELFRDGKITMDQMISGGQPLTLAELKAKYGAPVPKILTIDDYIKHGAKLTGAMPDGALNPSLLHAEIIKRLHNEVGINTPCLTKSGGEGAKLAKLASQLFPDSWTGKTDSFGNFYTKAKEKTRGHCATLGAYYDQFVGRSVKVHDFGTVAIEKNAGYMMVRKGDLGNAVHEYTHRMQAAMPELDKLFQDIHKRRTLNDPLEKLKDIYPAQGYKISEVSRKDKYINAYQGKEYNKEALEVMTMAMEYVLGLTENHWLSNSRLDNFKKFYKDDRELFDFTVGVLFKWKP